MAFVKILSVVLASMLLSSCALLGLDGKSNQLLDDQAELVSRDFVTALSKLRGFSPRETTVQLHNPTTLFSKKLHDTMRSAGYGMQIVSKDEKGANHVSYISDQYETVEGTTAAYEVRVGDVKLGREYEIRAGRVFPITALSVNGATSDGNTTVDNSIFGQPENDRRIVVGPTSPIDGGSRNDTDKNAKSLLGNLAFNQNVPIALKKNVAVIGQSNYSSLFKLYQPTRSETLVFPNDSLVLGAKNKSTIYSLAQQFDTNTQVISVVGCSIGKTKIDNGNALLANGRANRVKEELILAGVSPDSILDEGCWAGSRVDNIPGRGVILTLRTKISQG